MIFGGFMARYKIINYYIYIYIYIFGSQSSPNIYHGSNKIFMVQILFKKLIKKWIKKIKKKKNYYMRRLHSGLVNRCWIMTQEIAGGIFFCDGICLGVRSFYSEGSCRLMLVWTFSPLDKDGRFLSFDHRLLLLRV